MGQSAASISTSQEGDGPAKELRFVEYPVTLMEREDTDHRVELVYHGPEARQQVTIHVYWNSGEFPDFAFGVEDDQVLQAFWHPYAYEHRPLAA
jgi:hypothetical protein